MKLLSKAVTLMSIFVAVDSFAHFRDRIPNGHTMKHPCKVNYMWYGVGHENPQGGGARNPFGEDFEKYGFEWNECLCRADSDHDGRTNGEELGDPGCQWKLGQQPANIVGISHPGVCEPIDSPGCLQVNKFLNCALDTEFNCDAIKDPDVKNMTLHFPETVVPADETTYICQAFNISADVDSHVIATTPMIINRNVMHHILLFACTEDEEEAAMAQYSRPTPCSMVSCLSVVGTWTLGTHGQCLNNKTGIKIGKSIFRTVVLQVHWNNPERRSDYVDSSGITLYHTTKFREYDAGTFITGPVAIQIPPGYLHYQTSGGCSGQCMSTVLGVSPIHIVRVAPHMHYLGSNFSFQHLRAGNVINRVDLARYIYDSPEVTELQTPFIVMPGDELKVVCGFTSKARTEFTHYGEATSDEMCAALLMYYPYKPTAQVCLTTNGYGFCDISTVMDPKKMLDSFNEHCNYSDFQSVLTKASPTMTLMCDSTGIVCRPGCEEAMAIVKNHQCLRSPVAEYIKLPMQRLDRTGKGRMILNMLASCDPKPVSTVGEVPVASRGVCEERPTCVGDGNVACKAVHLTVSAIVFVATIIVIAM